MEHIALIAILLTVLAAAAISRRIDGSIITLPIVYTGLGLLIGSAGLGFVEIGLNNEFLIIVVELTLVLVLASDATRINTRILSRDHDLPLRLLGIGLPLTMILGAVLAYFMFGRLGFWSAAILAIVLAPTDASLGQAVVSNPRVPMRIRQALNVESGLNDGIAMPFLLLAIDMALAKGEGQPAGGFVLSASTQIVLGIAVGIAVGWVGAIFLNWGRRSGWISSSFHKISFIALVLLAYFGAEIAGGNGFIAAFCMGLAVGRITDSSLNHEIEEHTEVEVEALIMLTFILFGAVLLPLALDNFTAPIVLYALLSLTLVRMLPVGISLLRSGVTPVTSIFIGWFGPRGTASILYIFTVLDAESLFSADLIYDIVMITVFFSVILHGVTAAPASNRYGKIMANEARVPSDAMEHEAVPEMKLRTTRASNS